MRLLQRFDRRVAGPAAVLGACGFLLALLLTQGLPYWDVDYTVNFAATAQRGLGGALLDWILPVHDQWLPQLQAGADAWGFLDRAAEFVSYRASFAIAGYDAWPYYLFKDAAYGGMCALLYLWAVRAAGAGRGMVLAAAAVTVFFMFAPPPVAALVWSADFAPVSELAMLALSLAMWSEIERTPPDWRSPLPLIRKKAQRLGVWLALALATYLAYKTKADLKLLPVIVAVYVAAVRLRQWRYFALPLGAMAVLAIPWQSIGRPPPFLPGGAAPATTFFWHPASLDSLRRFLWADGPYDFIGGLTEGSYSLGGLLGPFALTALAITALWLWAHNEEPLRIRLGEPAVRARIFAAIWLLVALAGASALPAIREFYRVRYGILTLTPACILLAWPVAAALRARVRLPALLAAACALLLLIQTAVNLSRSIAHRIDLGRTMVEVDQAYAFADAREPHGDLALWPPFLSYDYRPDSSLVARRDPVATLAELGVRHPAGRTLVIGWTLPRSDEVAPLAVFSGCRPNVLFDRLAPCVPGAHDLFVGRYFGPRSAAEFVDLSAALEGAGRHAQAAAAARRAILLDPRNAVAYNNLAAADESLQRWDDAIAAARAALRLQPHFALAQNNLRYSLARKRARGTRR